ncbi:ATPase [Pseudoxanthomonas spadix BD-a59]|uniref:ATPase n=2 Tax=Pseudoxanthomonas spadix TaxID=415229 RepID=G7UQ46_PSEUP|nr:ATPase [Pseudoxanthomonas spadix BD-a59]
MTDAELEASRAPHPHVFQAGERGLFPLGEVSVIGARGREGKTTVIVGLAVAVAIQHDVGRLNPPVGRSVVIFSAEDDRRQYARKVAAQCSQLGPQQAAQVKRRILVPDLDSQEMAAFRTLVTVADRSPVPTGTDAALVEAMRPLMDRPDAPVLVVFETASTLSDAEEDTRGHKMLIACLKRVARELNVACILVHHTSQAADNNLADLNISTADIRGGTALVYNSRQNAMLVNLGSDADPFDATDARTVLRKMAGSHDGRVTALVTLDSSKGMDPPPLFFAWRQTDFGPAAIEHEPLPTLQGKPWRKVREMVMAERGNVRAEARSNAQGASVTHVVALAEKLHKAGKQPTARAVSVAAGKSSTWAKPYLEAAVDEGLLTCTKEPIPRMKDGGAVYRPADSTVVVS